MVACTQICPERVGDVYDAIMHDFWFEKKGLQLPELFEPIFKDVLGDELARRVIEMVSSEYQTMLAKY